MNKKLITEIGIEELKTNLIFLAAEQETLEVEEDDDKIKVRGIIK